MEYYKILNKFELLNNFNNCYILNIFYLEDYLCKVIIINKNNCGWDDDIKIKLYNKKLLNNQKNLLNNQYEIYEKEIYEQLNDEQLNDEQLNDEQLNDEQLNDYNNNNNNEEILSLGSSNKNYKIIDFYTNVKLQYSKYNIKNNINLIMIETNEININNYLIKYMNFIENDHQNINYIFFDNIFKRQFIKDNYLKYLNYYDLLIDINYKNLIFVLLYLYTNGGYYISHNIFLKKNILNLNNVYFVNNYNLLEILITYKNNKCIIEYVDHLILNNGNLEDIHNIFKSNVKILQYSSFYMNDQLKISKDKFRNIWKANKYIFMINGIYDYEGEYLNMNYYFIRVKNNEYIEKNLTIYYLNEDNDILNYLIYNDENKKTFVFKLI